MWRAHKIFMNSMPNARKLALRSVKFVTELSLLKLDYDLRAQDFYEVIP